MKLFKHTLFMALFFYTSCQAIYRAPSLSDTAYTQAALPFNAVMKIKVKGTQPFEESYGTGSYVEDARTGKRFILTAAHVLKPGGQAYIITPDGDIPLKDTRYFANDLQDYYKTQKVALSFINDVRQERLFGGRIDNPSILEAINHYGGDLAIAFLPDNITLKVTPFNLSTYTDFETHGPAYVVGFGASGVIGPVGGWTGSVYGAGRKRAYTPALRTGIVIKMIDLDTFQEIHHMSWMEITTLNNGYVLPGQVGYGDSGGPVLRLTRAGTYEIIGVVSSVLPAYRSPLFIQTLNGWQKFIIRIGSKLESKSYGSYVFGCQGNTYGSEALFSGVISPLVHAWIKRCLN